MPDRTARVRMELRRAGGGRPRSHDLLLVIEAERIRLIGAERRDRAKPHALVQADGRVLVDARFEPQEPDAALEGIGGQVVDQQRAQPRPRNAGRTYMRLSSPYAVP